MKERLQKKLGKAFNSKLADAVFDITIAKKGEQTLAQARAGVSPGKEHQTRGVVYDMPSGKASLENIYGSQYRHMRQAIIIESELIDENKEPVTPELDDILISDGGKFLIRSVVIDPSKAVWVLDLESL